MCDATTGWARKGNVDPKKNLQDAIKRQDEEEKRRKAEEQKRNAEAQKKIDRIPAAYRR